MTRPRIRILILDGCLAVLEQIARFEQWARKRRKPAPDPEPEAPEPVPGSAPMPPAGSARDCLECPYAFIEHTS